MLKRLMAIMNPKLDTYFLHSLYGQFTSMESRPYVWHCKI